VPIYISHHFRTYNIKNNAQIKFFDSNNFIISTEFLNKNKLNFDERFNFTGGEDRYFGTQALKFNAKIVWSKNALVYESIPVSRANLSWLIKRKFRTSNRSTYIKLLEKNY